MAWDLSVMAIPAIHYNTKGPETIGTFCIFISIGAKQKINCFLVPILPHDFP